MKKTNMLWINFLHLYQPVHTDAHIIKEATEMSYWRLVRALEEHPRTKFTLNISGCLFLRWEELGYSDLIKRIGGLVERGQVELTGSAAYHPLLPLIPEEEVIKQIKENEEILKKHFGADFKPKGFFLPEMAYGSSVAKIVKDLGYEWLILDEIACCGCLDKVDFSKAYLDKNSGLKIAFRSRKISKSYVPDTLTETIKDKKDSSTPIITATDGELYGLRHNDPTAVFEKLLDNKKLQTQTISEFLNGRTTEEVVPVACSWETTEEEIKAKKPYALWHDKKNKIQNKIWDLAFLAYNILKKYQNDKNYSWARWH